MALRTIVKINKVNNLSDARYCAGMGVDLMGFCLDPTNEDVVSPEKFAEITGWISGVRLVGEFYESSTVVIKELIEKYTIDYIQINNPQDLEYMAQLKIPLILDVDVSALDEPGQLRELIEEKENLVSYFLLSIQSQDDEKEALAAYVSEISALSNKYPLLLGFGLDAATINELLGETSITGIALQGGHEIKPGYKDFDELADILETIELDDF